MPAPDDFVPDGTKPGDFTSDASVMNPHPIKSGLKRVGKVIGQYDPSNPANVGRVAPIAAGAASASLGMLGPEGTALRAGLSAVGGAAAPYAEYLAAKASGQQPELPNWKDALKGGLLNLLFERTGSKIAGAGHPEVAPEIGALPEELRTPVQIRQAARNRDFLKKLGMTDPQIDEALKDPEGTAALLQRSIDRSNKVVDNYTATVKNERTAFSGRYDTALGRQATATVDNQGIANQMRAFADSPSQHELSPAFANWLRRKANELSPEVKVDRGRPLDTAESIAATEGAPTGGALPSLSESMRARRELSDELFAQGKKPATESATAEPLTVKSARELNTELAENVPSNPTQLDKKAAKQLNDFIENSYETSMRKAGASEEQLGQLKGIDADYARFIKTIRKLDPRSDTFGEQAADAFFESAKQNPTLALNYVRMAQDAGQIDQFRDAFMQQLTQEMRGTSGGPINQMQVLRKIQEGWGSTEDGKAVLTSVFGKGSPMADPITFSRVMGAENNPAAINAAKQVGRYMRSPEFIVRLGTFYATYSLIVGHGASPWSDFRKDPERALAGLAGAMATQAGIRKVMSSVSPPIQRAYANWLVSGNPEAFGKLVQMGGAATGGVVSQPSDQNP